MKIKIIRVCSLFFLFYPVLMFAQSTGPTAGYFTKLIREATTVVRGLLVFLIALAVVWFIWNVVRYAMSEDESGKEKAKSQMIWGIIAIAVIVSVWGLVGILQNVFGLNQGATSFTGDLQGMIPGVQ